MCGYFLGMGVTNGVTGTNCNPPGSVSMCASTLTKFAASWKTTFGTKAGCDAWSPVTSLGDVYSRFSPGLSSASTCVVSVAAENSNCDLRQGFATAAESKVFCATTPAETCCNNVKAAVATTTAAITTSAVAPAATSLSQSTIMYIGGSGGLFLVVFTIALACCCKRKTKLSEDSNYGAQQLSSNAPPQDAYANERSLLNQNAAPMGVVGQPPIESELGECWKVAT
ncbi:hypothetical protein BJ741DRAFT_575481 [Chytriomyces cf. hyalinus JEL632]|nr:hypothetical protein BJ741DRAFT_575481 [Chytriomyces cf. hyalinus JEL632]